MQENTNITDEKTPELIDINVLILGKILNGIT